MAARHTGDTVMKMFCTADSIMAYSSQRHTQQEFRNKVELKLKIKAVPTT